MLHVELPNTESTTVVFLELFPPVAYPEVMLIRLIR